MSFKRFQHSFLLALVFPLAALGAKLEPGEEIISQVLSLGVPPAPAVQSSGDENEGRYDRLVIKNINLIDGAGAPTQGPVTVEISQDRIVAIHSSGTGSLHMGGKDYSDDTRIIDGTGKYLLPGFIDAHIHYGTPTHGLTGSLTDPTYVGKLFLAHGITTVRDAGSLMGLDWTLDLKQRSERGEISAPRIRAHAMLPESINGPDEARKWVRAVHKKGADGIKFIGGSPEAIEAGITEAKSLGMKTMFHHAQTGVVQMDVLDTAGWGLDSMEHWYGLPEAMFEDRVVQDYSADYNYNNEQDRFSEAGRLWAQAAEPGSATWQRVIDELVAVDFTINPTMTIYESNRDVMRARRADWLDEYTMPYISRAFEPNPVIHGSYHYDWKTSDEIAWRENYRLWMRFLNDYKNAGGRVTVGADSGFIYGLYGFGYVRELELLQEAGFHPLEVIKSATYNGAQLLGMEDESGSIQVGKKADLVIVDANPLENFKVLYATGHMQRNPETGQVEQLAGIRYTIKDGYVFNGEKLRVQIKAMVADRKAAEAASQ